MIRARSSAADYREVTPCSGSGGCPLRHAVALGIRRRPEEVRDTLYDATFRFAAVQLAVWTSFPVRIEGDNAVADLTMGLGDEIWAVIGWNSQPDD